MKGHLRMSQKERDRKSVFDQVGKGGLKLTEAAAALGLGYRQCKRSYRRYREEGDAGLVHRRRGRASNRRKPAAMKQSGSVVLRATSGGLWPDVGGREAWGTRLGCGSRDVAALVAGGGSMDAAWPTICAPFAARAAGSFWRVGPNGRESPPLVWGGASGSMSDEYGG